MILRRMGFLGASLVLALGGCAASSSPAREDPPVATTSAATIPAGVCTDLRWVGARPGSTCPTPGAGWLAESLFPAAAPLPQFCVYEWTGDGAPGLSGLPKKSPGDDVPWLDRDCFVVAGQSTASSIEGIVRPSLTASHRRQVEMPLARVRSGNAPVTIAILDTWPSASQVGRSSHGFGMAGIAEGIACDALSGGTCPIRAVPFLALDRYGLDARKDELHGGDYGAQSQLARAIYQAVSAPGSDKRVLNLSVAWDGVYNTTAANVPSLPFLAVRAALEYAACQDALVITAAGNAPGGPVPRTGPAYPAAFERAPPVVCRSGRRRNLVYSVGGVDGRDEPLVNTRPLGRPALAAPSFAVPGARTVGGTVTAVGPLSGSSVSAAVVSAIAALVWNARPSLTPPQVMEKIHGSGAELSGFADYCSPGASCGRIKRASVCRALASVRPGLSCTGVTIPAGAGTNPSYSLVDLARIGSQGSLAAAFSGPLARLGPVAGCRPDIPIFSSAPGGLLGAPELCPSEVLTSDLIAPSLDPQPGPDPCPACMVLKMPSPPGPEVLVPLSITMPISDEAHAGVSPRTLSLFDASGALIDRYDLGSAEDGAGNTLRDGLTPGETYSVSLDVLTDFDSAAIEWAAEPFFTPSFPVVLEPSLP